MTPQAPCRHKTWGRPALATLRRISRPAAAVRKATKLVASGRAALRRPDVAGSAAAIVWPRPGVTQITTVEVPRAGDGSVTVEIDVSVVSPGTERARFLALENARVPFPHRPGYQAAGRVTRDPTGTLVGRRVAVRGAPHQRLVTVSRRDVHEIPDGVAMSAAATWPLGITALHGLRVADPGPLTSVAVVGSGLLGLLTRRLATAAGATRVLAVAASDAKRWTLQTEPSTEFLVAADADDVGAAHAPLVIDATGTPGGLLVATALAAPGGAVVLLGSPRCDVAPLPVAALREKGVRVVGAHVDTIELMKGRTARDSELGYTEEYFEHLRSGHVALDDVLTEQLPAAHAAAFYRRLVTDRRIVGAVFDWVPGDAGAGPAALVGGSSTGRRPVAPLRFGLLGCGDIGVQNARAIADADGAELRVCFDPVDRLADQVAGATGATLVTSWEAVLERDDVDAVFVATPHDLHEAVVVAAVAAGKHVVVEKPLAADLPAAVRIAAAAALGSATVTICFSMRDDERVADARRAIDAGALGAPHGLLATYLADKPPSYYFGGFSSRSPSTWRLSKERSGGGVLMMNLVHHLDLARHLLGREATQVTASMAALHPDAEIEDLASVVVDFDGVLATFVGGSTVVRGPGESLRIWGDIGQVQVLPTVAVRSLVPSDPLVATAKPGGGARWAVGRVARRVRRQQGPAAPPPDDDFVSRVRFLERTVSRIARGEPPDPSVADGLAVQAMVAAAYAAAERHAVVRPAALLADAAR